MNTPDKTFIDIIFRKISSFNKLIVLGKNVKELVFNLNEKYGYKQTTINQKPIDINHNPLPWFTYPAIEYLSQFDLSQKTIFEWGSGNSSLFFAKICKTIVSVESDKEWFNYVSQDLSENQKIFLVEEEKFSDFIDEKSIKYDIIIIDSLRRYDCAVKAINHLNEGGLIILDNSDWHPNTSELLRNSGNLIEVDMHGFGPINSYSSTTSLYLHREFCFTPKENLQPTYSKAAIRQISKYDYPFNKLDDLDPNT